MLALQTVFGSEWSRHPEPKRTVALSQDTQEKDPVEGPAKVSVKGCVSPENNKERNSEE